MASKRVQIQGVVNPEERGVLFRTSSDERCNATQSLDYFRSHHRAIIIPIPTRDTELS